jgi:hypothetical protein
MQRYYRAAGTQWTLTGITRSSQTATATKNAHGFTSGDSVTIAGATQTEYNGTFTISNVTTNTFDYTVTGAPASPATGTITCLNNTRVVAAQSPDSNPEAWVRIYNVLPNCEDGLFVNNRFLCITAYTPGSATYDSNSSYTKADFVVATDYLDEEHFDFANEFRINQGSDDVLLELVKFGDDLVVAFKERSWGVLGNVGIDLSELTLDMRGQEYGLTVNGAVAAGGADLFFVAEKRGVVSIRQTEQGKVQSVDIPFSRAIQPLIDRIAWQYKSKIRCAYWDNKLYVAVPLDDGVSKQYVKAEADTYDGDGYVSVSTRMTIGETYHVEMGNATGVLANGVSVLDGDSFVEGSLSLADGSGITFPYTVNISGTEGEFCTARLWQALTGVNNCILVYDFLNGQWASRDTGSALTVKEFVKFTYQGTERLFFIGEDGFVSLLEESEDGDQVYDEFADTLLNTEEIYTRLRTRGYRVMPVPAQQGGRGGGNSQQAERLTLALARFDAQVSTTLVYDGAFERKTVNADPGSGSASTVFGRDRTKYERPFDKADYDESNVNGDFAVPYRQDYSVNLGTGIYLTGGVRLSQFQETQEVFALDRNEGRVAQVEVESFAGRVQLREVSLDGKRVKQRKGAHT